MLTKKYLNDLTYEVIGATIQVHKVLGRGLLESVYHRCLIEELIFRKINFLTEMKVPIVYRNKVLDIDLRCDLFIENSLVLELKSVQEMPKVFDAQILTYMKLLRCPKGILINFNCANIFKEGQKTFVNEYFSILPD
ncbi:GxxExxY protein [Pedobacter cryotolerans]|uniref:GxxExxY protein n=1 Tax=Pedobacter cryotolerans TaxID=2571270 RepID=A0A4U1CBP4_9SPHI|nr:GxxExxY protein [Pedobacter cryotolerans]TKC03368.1 GxxExxY protein [Pedobacter cryotolerans]